jgi:hypothetical protein
MAEAPAQKIRGSQTKHLSSTCSASNITWGAETTEDK